VQARPVIVLDDVSPGYPVLSRRTKNNPGADFSQPGVGKTRAFVWGWPASSPGYVPEGLIKQEYHRACDMGRPSSSGQVPRRVSRKLLKACSSEVQAAECGVEIILLSHCTPVYVAARPNGRWTPATCSTDAGPRTSCHWAWRNHAVTSIASSIEKDAAPLERRFHPVQCGPAELRDPHLFRSILPRPARIPPPPPPPPQPLRVTPHSFRISTRRFGPWSQRRCCPIP